MPLQLDGQLTLTPLPTAGPSGMKRAMLLRLSEESLDALSADLASGKYPQVHFQFDGTPAITIGDQLYPLAGSRENYEHELYRRAINTRTPSGLRMFGKVTGAFRVHHQDVTARAQEKLRNSTLVAEQKKSERHTLYIDEAVDPRTVVNGKRKKANASLGDKAVNRLATTKEARTTSASASNPSHAGASSSSVLATTRIVTSRAAEVEHPPRPSVPARPKLAKNAGAPPPRSTRDGEILTSTFRGGILTKDAKKPAAKAAKDKPSAADNAAPKASSSKAKLAARDWDGEPDDLPLAITTRTAGVAKTANGNARSSITGSSTSAVGRSRDSASGTPLAKARESANGTPTKKMNGQSSSAAPTAAMALANAIAAASSSSSASAVAATKKAAQPDSAKRKRALDDDDDDYLGPGAKKPAAKSAQKGAQKTALKSAQDSPPAAKRKRPADDDEFTVGPSRKQSLASEAGTIKRKRALANDDDEYEGPGAVKKRKSIATSATSLTAERTTASRPALNGTAKKLAATTTTKKEPSRSPNLAPPQPVAPPPAPPVTRLPRANDEPTLAKTLRFKKDTKVEKVEKVEIATPNTSASSISVKAETPANGLSRRRSTPTFTSTEDEEEAEEGELRPAKKKSKVAHSRKPAPPQKPVITWRPEPLPSDHTKLRSRYHATYVEYTSDLYLFAKQRDLLNRRLERPDGATADSDSEVLGEEELEKVKQKHVQVVDELSQIRKLLETPAQKAAS